MNQSRPKIQWRTAKITKKILKLSVNSLTEVLQHTLNS